MPTEICLAETCDRNSIEILDSPNAGLAFELYRMLYGYGKIPAGGFGPQGYDGRYIKNLGREGQPLWEFIKNLREQGAADRTAA